jgi:hypothetical protein
MASRRAAWISGSAVAAACTAGSSGGSHGGTHRHGRRVSAATSRVDPGSVAEGPASARTARSHDARRDVRAAGRRAGRRRARGLRVAHHRRPRWGERPCRDERRRGPLAPPRSTGRPPRPRCWCSRSRRSSESMPSRPRHAVSVDAQQPAGGRSHQGFTPCAATAVRRGGGTAQARLQRRHPRRRPARRFVTTP